MRIGSHQSASGGIDKVFDRALADECESFQVFVKSPTRWEGKPFTEKEIDNFKRLAKSFGEMSITGHSSYLINLASLDDEVKRKSLKCISDELLKCSSINIPYHVMHPGSKGEGDHDNALTLIATALDDVYSKNDISTMLLLENTSGAGNHTGGEVEDLAKIIERCKMKDKIGVCIDTCHAYVYGYDIVNELDKFKDKLISLFGNKLKVFHLNDTQKGLGSKLDRHEFLGKGNIGYNVFKELVRDKRLSAVLGILETPVKDNECYLDEVRLLKNYRDEVQ